MSLGPLDKPADLQSVLPVQVLSALGGMFLVLVEGLWHIGQFFIVLHR